MSCSHCRSEFRRRLLHWAATPVLAVACAFVANTADAGSADAPRTRSPNIVLIFTDDQGYADLACFGGKELSTPNLDRMAAEGMKLTDFYSNCAVCSGSRAALMTGSHYQRTGIRPVLFPRDTIGLNPNEITMAEVLKSRGYATACIGKWHLGHLPQFLPTKQGFDSYFGIPYSNDMAIDPAMKLAKDVVLREGWTAERIRSEPPKGNTVPLFRGEEVIEYPVDQSTLTRRYTEETVAFMKAHKDEPFFVYLPHNMCHVPLYVSEKFRGKTSKGLFGDVIAELDWSVGEILAATKALGIDEHTLVLFTTDNGAASGSALPLRGKKATMYEGGVRVPCIARWPGRIPAGKTCSEVAATIDLLPTFAKLAGAAVPTDRAIDGHDILPLLEGRPDAKSPHDYYCLAHGNGSVRHGKWKFYPWPEGAANPGGGGKKKGAAAKKGAGGENAPAKPDEAKPGVDPAKPAVQLYDLSTDLSETKNLATEHPELVKQLQQVFDAFKADLQQRSRPVGQAG